MKSDQLASVDQAPNLANYLIKLPVSTGSRRLVLPCSLEILKLLTQTPRSREEMFPLLDHFD
jgi:hypothetical protein